LTNELDHTLHYVETTLGQWLEKFQVIADEFEEVQGRTFKARIWRMKETQQHLA